MRSRYRRGRAQHDAWPVIADLFLVLIAVVVVLASGRQPIDSDVERFKKALAQKRADEFADLLADAEIRPSWARLVFTEQSLSFPKCRWSVPPEKQQELLSLFDWIGTHAHLIRQIRIEGHADRKWEGQGCRDVGPFMDNLQLSQNRARAIYNLLLGLSPETGEGLQQLLTDSEVTVDSRNGIGFIRTLAKRGCLEVAGYGDRHPRDRADPDSPKNRRVEVVLEFRERSPSPSSKEGTNTVCEAVE